MAGTPFSLLPSEAGALDKMMTEQVHKLMGENDVGRRPAGDGCREEVYKFLLLRDAQCVPCDRTPPSGPPGDRQATKG